MNEFAAGFFCGWMAMVAWNAVTLAFLPFEKDEP